MSKFLLRPLMSHPRITLVFAQVLIGTAAASAAPISYECEPEGDVFYVVDLVQQGGGMTATIGPRSEYIQKPKNEIARQVPAASGVLFESRSYIFHTKGSDALLSFKEYPNNAPLPCTVTASAQTHASGAVGGSETSLGAARARSLGGKLRNGPGINFSSQGSLSEGTEVSVVANTGVQMDGYDWFEVRHGARTFFQWGGVMCWESAPIAGMYGDCRSVVAGASSHIQKVSSSGGWMAFATGDGGRFGHGAGATRNEAISYAMSYCGDASCGVRDVTQERCHAYAAGFNGVWFGTSDTLAGAERFAMNFCKRAEAGCSLKYSYCR